MDAEVVSSRPRRWRWLAIVAVVVVVVVVVAAAFWYRVAHDVDLGPGSLSGSGEGFTFIAPGTDAAFPTSEYPDGVFELDGAAGTSVSSVRNNGSRPVDVSAGEQSAIGVTVVSFSAGAVGSSSSGGVVPAAGRTPTVTVDADGQVQMFVHVVRDRCREWAPGTGYDISSVVLLARQLAATSTKTVALKVPLVIRYPKGQGEGGPSCVTTG